MKTSSAFRFWAPAVLLTATGLASFSSVSLAQGQSPATPAATQAVLDSAHQLELRGRLDLATQRWQQVLLSDPNNTEALGGLARAAKMGGDVKLSNRYLDRLRAINPNDPGIARAEQAGTQAAPNTQLQQAGRLAQQGQYAQSMNIYRQLYGDQPPPGDQALAYYETEAATEDGRPHAIAGLRNLNQKFPADTRFAVALGRILTYNPKTRPEGRRILEQHPNNPEAVEALRQALLYDAQNPATAAEIRSYLSKHNDAQLSQVLRNEPRTGGGGKAPAPQTPEQRAAAAVNATRNADDRAAYAALNAKKLPEAESRFKAILAKTPDDPNALAGMGYIRMQQTNFGGATSFLVQAKQDGSKDPGLDNALATSRFYYTMSEGQIALNEGDLPLAEKQYRAALAMRANNPEALEGLGGTLLKAQQPEAAVPVFVEFVKVKPSAAHAWRGLFIAEFGAGDAPRALATERQFPAAVRAELMKDPLYLRSLSSAYLAVGRDADAARVLKSALDLPFPADSKGLEVDTQLQYAGLLQQANRLDQAAGLYRQVLAHDQNNTAAWQGLVRVEHALDQDDQALQTIESMPPGVYAQAMRDTGFEQTVASIYQTQKRLDVAQDLLEKALAQQTNAGQKPSVPAEIQLAGIYLQRDNPQQAYPLYRQVLSQTPDRTEVWLGLIQALHSTGKDAEALAEVPQIPSATRARLEQNVDFLQVIGQVYNALGQTQQAEVFLRRVQQHYLAQHTLPPADIDIQNAYLLYDAHNDPGLYQQLLALGGRTDLTDAQRRTVQTIWANYAVRRANQLAAAGQDGRAVAILNTTAQAFGDNPDVLQILAGGYSSAGMSKRAVLIWKSRDLKTAPSGDYEAAVGAALAANDLKDAETWLRFGLDQYPKDAALLVLAAKFEEARGDSNRAADYYHSALGALPAPNPGSALVTELSRPGPLPSGTPTVKPGQDLATLLKPGKDDLPPEPATMNANPVSSQPYLPSYGAGSAPIQVYVPGSSDTSVPSYGNMPGPGSPLTQTPTAPSGTTRLRDYVPQSRLTPMPLGDTDVRRPADAMQAVASFTDGSPLTVSLAPAMLHQELSGGAGDSLQEAQTISPMYHQASYYEPQQAQSSPPDTTVYQPYVPYKPGPLTTQPVSAQPAAEPATSPAVQPSIQAAPAKGSDEVYGAYVPYVPPSAAPVYVPVQPLTPVQAPASSVAPTTHYVPNAQSRPTDSSHPEINAATAASARRRPSSSASVAAQPRTGESKPPAEDYSTTGTETVQYNSAAAAQVSQPTGQAANRNGVQLQQNGTGQPPQGGTGDSNGQQYPQPNTAPRGTAAAPTTSRGRARSRNHVASAPATPPATAPADGQPAAQGLSYPGVGQSLGYQPYPVIGPAYPLGAPPTDADLMGRRLPPLRGVYITENLPPPAPLSPREQTERDLATLEASYSGWLGGTVSARYRSGTPGLDRLTDLEANFDASATLNNGIRLTVVPKVVFLNSGTVDLTQYTGLNTNGVPILGTLPLNTINQPAQQNTSGVGGELQVAGNRFAVAAGYTPYEFLVRNVTGRALYKPDNHFTFFFNRDSVNETQLSYAGLRDPGSVSAVFPGNVWGGVVATGGGLRFDKGDEKAGFYLTADGSDLTGYHVLQNSKFEGSAGAYFLAHTFPGYGRLNIGASVFGMHFAHNERAQTYGLGGYFSPDAYFLASVPVTFAGRYGSNFHYVVAGSIGIQTFQEDSQIYFPLDPAIETAFRSSANGVTATGQPVPCTVAQIATGNCISLPNNSNTGGNYSINAEGAYRISDHWYGGGFLTANNTNNYNTVTGGFFVRYLFRPQYATDDYPTGLFPVDGFRPLRVP